MSKTKNQSFTAIIAESLGWPLFWGLSATAGFYLLIGWGIISSELVSRYFAGHPVEYIETALFFVGVVALLLKAGNLAFQFRSIPAIVLPEPKSDGDEPSRAAQLLETISALPLRLRETYLAKRLANSLRYIKQSDSVEEIDEQLRYLSDVDAERSHDGYSLVRMIIWATPMLGFLGTVIGITVALGNLSPEALVNAPKEAMQGLLAGLSVAFDTTALALSLSIVLMFLQYLVREVETRLLTIVDRKTEDELIGRFQTSGTASDPNVNTIKLMSQRVVESVEALAARQTELWDTAISATQRQWNDALQTTSAAVQNGFQEALTESITHHTQAVMVTEQNSHHAMRDHWEQVQASMKDQADLLSAQHDSLLKQGDTMLRVLEATGEISTLETALNQNLSALAGAKNFEDTVVSLSAAIQLLTSRVGIATHDRSLQAEKGKAA